MNPASHLEPRVLTDYVAGKLSAPDAEAVERHLAECPQCEATLQAIESEHDKFVGGLREKPIADDYIAEAELQRAVESAASFSKAEFGRTERPDALTRLRGGDSVADPGLTKLGPYHLLAKIGEGGMGAVYKAQHEHLGKVVAVKILPAKALRDPELVARFRREMKAVGALHHPNIVGAHDAGEADGVHFLVMEYVAGRDLSSLVKREGPLTVERAVSYLLQAARGLEFAHRKGIVHRDIKPANLLVDADGALKILDMGLARLDDGAEPSDVVPADDLTQSGQMMGTVDYMAPEQAFDSHRADAKSDVYSLGCTLYRLLTAKSPYHGDSTVQKILAHREQPIPPLTTTGAAVPAALESLYRRMLAKRPDDRPTMSEVVVELEQIATSPKAASASRAAEHG